MLRGPCTDVMQVGEGDPVYPVVWFHVVSSKNIRTVTSESKVDWAREHEVCVEIHLETVWSAGCQAVLTCFHRGRIRLAHIWFCYSEKFQTDEKK